MTKDYILSKLITLSHRTSCRQQTDGFDGSGRIFTDIVW